MIPDRFFREQNLYAVSLTDSAADEMICFSPEEKSMKKTSYDTEIIHEQV